MEKLLVGWEASVQAWPAWLGMVKDFVLALLHFLVQLLQQVNNLDEQRRLMMQLILYPPLALIIFVCFVLLIRIFMSKKRKFWRDQEVRVLIFDETSALRDQVVALQRRIAELESK